MKPRRWLTFTVRVQGFLAALLLFQLLNMYVLTYLWIPAVKDDCKNTLLVSTTSQLAEPSSEPEKLNVTQMESCRYSGLTPHMTSPLKTTAVQN
jgi:hypothetical protein